MKDLLVVLKDDFDPVMDLVDGIGAMGVGLRVQRALVVTVEGDLASIVERLLQAADREFVELPGQPVAPAPAAEATVVLPGMREITMPLQDAVDLVVGKPARKPRGPRAVKVVLEERECEHCKKMYQPKRKDQKHCYSEACRKERTKLYQANWAERNRAALAAAAQDFEADLAAMDPVEAERIVVPADPLREDMEVEDFGDLLDGVTDGDLVAGSLENFDLDAIFHQVDDEDETIEWTLCASGERFTDDALKIVLAGKVLLPGTLLRKRGGKFFTVTGMHEMKQVHLAADVTSGLVKHGNYWKVKVASNE